MDPFEGFRDFVLARGPALSRTAYLLTGDHHAAEELLQAALARTAAHWRRIRDGNPEGYVRRAMVNQRTSWWRGRRAQLVAEVPDVPEPDGSDRAADRLLLARALVALPPRQRAVVVLRFYEDMPEREVAEALGCSVGTVKSQTHDALRKLRALLPDGESTQTEVTR